MKRQKPLPHKHATRWKILIAASSLILFGWFCLVLLKDQNLWVTQTDRPTERVEEVIVDGLRAHSPSGPLQLVHEQTPLVGPRREMARHPLQKSTKAGKKSSHGPSAPRMMGPYAPVVYELLSETLFEDQLIQLGILTPDESLHLPLLKALPAQLPARGRITSKFGKRKSPFSKRIVHHKGVDVAVRRGSPVKATGDGVVVFTGWHGGYGKLVEVDHGFGIVSRYGHNQRLIADVGDRVTRGQVIALAGSSGRSTGPHVHYEVAIHGQEVDPIQVMFPNTRELIAKEEAEFERQVRAGSILAENTDGAQSEEENLEPQISSRQDKGSGLAGQDEVGEDNLGVGGDEEGEALAAEQVALAEVDHGPSFSVWGEPKTKAEDLFKQPFWLNLSITSGFMVMMMLTLLIAGPKRARSKAVSSRSIGKRARSKAVSSRSIGR